MSSRRQQSENALFIFCLLKNTIQSLGAKNFDLNQGAKLELIINCCFCSRVQSTRFYTNNKA